MNDNSELDALLAPARIGDNQPPEPQHNLPAETSGANQMIAYEIPNRFTDSVQFTAEIECADDATTSIKIGLAVRWAFNGGADLRGADLGGADLRGADLRGADLGGADLRGADLRGADLRGADLGGADLRGADLGGADLSGADLGGAAMGGADLRGADLSGADLSGADLGGAAMGGADLGDHKLAKGQSIAMLGEPNDWSAFTYFTDKGEQRIRVGCQDKTIADGRAYWANKPDRREVLACLDYAEAIAHARGWIKG